MPDSNGGETRMHQNHGMSDPRDSTTRAARVRRRRRAAMAIACALAAPLAARAQTVPDNDEAFYQRAAVCAAAMEVDQLALVMRVRAGDAAARAPLVDITRLGFSYVGEAYLRGMRNPRADDMLKAERIEVRTWDDARREKTVGECRVEAQAIYDSANALTQSLLMNRVNKRVDKFISSPNPPPGAPSAPMASR